MPEKVIIAVLAGAVVVAIIVVLMRARRSRSTSVLQRAIASFPALPHELEDAFLAAASAGKGPRGLRWKSCQLAGPPLFAAERASGELYALVGATIAFEAIEGGGMEDVDAVGNLRAATAVFVYRRGAWTTDGRALFNLDPQGALDHYGGALTAVALG